MAKVLVCTIETREKEKGEMYSHKIINYLTESIGILLISLSEQN